MRFRKLLGLLIVGAVLLILAVLFWNKNIWRKATGRAPDCAWSQVLRSSIDESRTFAIQERLLQSLKVVSIDTNLGIERIQTPRRAYWIRSSGTRMNGVELLAFLILDIEHGAGGNPEENVRPGEVVLDCGAHVGIFTAKALELGASKVIAIEPDPTNLECLRRNFETEVASGRVIICPKGVWSSATTLELTESTWNSGMGSVVLRRDGRRVRIPVTTIDNLVRELSLDRVDFIKMDIEGAEREALKGAAQTIRRFSPRLALDSYHRADDMDAFRKLLPGFTYIPMGCERCDENPAHSNPLVTFWHKR